MISTRYGGAVAETDDSSDEQSKKRPRERIRRRGFDHDDSNVVPVAVTLRNTFAPRGQILKSLQLGMHANSRELDMSRSDESLSLPIHMEIVAPHSLLIELKNTYRSDKRMKKRIANMFGLGKMEKENSGRDSDIHRLTPICCMSYLDSCLSNTLKQSMSGTISHPVWDHIQEQLEDLYREVITATEATISTPSQATSDDENDDETSPWLQKNEDSKQLDLLNQRQEIWDRIKLSMRIQCKAIVDVDANIQSNLQNGIENGATSGHKSCHEPEFDVCRSDATYFNLSATSLDAKFLKKLPTNLEGNSMSDPSMLGPISKYSQSVPNALPRNSILVHFSDGSSRISPKLFEFLVKEGILDNDDNIYENPSGNQDHEHDNFSESIDHHIFNTMEDFQVDTFQNRFIDDLQGLSFGKWGLQRRDTSRSHWTGVETGSFADAFDSLTVKDRDIIETSLAMTLKNSGDRDNKNNQAERENSTAFFDLTSNSLQGIRSRQGSHHGSNEQSANDEMSDSSEKNGLEIINSIKKLDEQIENLSQMLNTEVSYYEEERIKHDQVGTVLLCLAKVCAMFLMFIFSIYNSFRISFLMLMNWLMKE